MSPSARNLATKTGSGTLPPDTTAPQGPGGGTFQPDAHDGFAAVPKTCLPRHTRTASSRLLHIHWRQTRQSAAAAVLQIRPRFKGKSCNGNDIKTHEGLEGWLWSQSSLLLCCHMRLTLSSVQAKQPQSSSHFSDSLVRSPFFTLFL